MKIDKKEMGNLITDTVMQKLEEDRINEEQEKAKY